MHPETLAARRRLYMLARVVVARHYRRELTLALVARAVASSPRQLQRAYAQFGELSFREDLHARRMAAAATLLLEQRSIPVRDVARLVGYSQPPHFARAFRRRYGLSPARFRARGRQADSHPRPAVPMPATPRPARPLVASAVPGPLPRGREGAGA
jgi:AraC family transcriptional regulator, regulatory protein of adaptative response / methylphosphotriester-DNA alkyltransferase methyltransferase